MARRPDLVLEHQDKKITMIDTACLKEKNIHERYYGKLHKYQQQEFEFRERKPGLRIAIVPILIGCMEEGMKKVKA